MEPGARARTAPPFGDALSALVPQPSLSHPSGAPTTAGTGVSKRPSAPTISQESPSLHADDVSGGGGKRARGNSVVVHVPIAHAPAAAPLLSPPTNVVSGAVPTMDEQRALRTLRWAREQQEADTRFAPPRKPPGGTLRVPPAAHRHVDTFAAAAAALFRVSVLPAPSLLATSLHRDGLPPQGGFVKARDAGTVLLLHPGLFLVERLPHGEAVSRGGAIARAANMARAGSTFALTARHCPTEVVLANRPVPLDMCDVYLRRVRQAGDPTVIPPSGHVAAPLTTATSLAGWEGALMPALAHAVSQEAALIAVDAERDGNVRTVYSLRLRARASLLSDTLTRSLQWDTSPAVPEGPFVRALHAAQLEAACARPGDTRPYSLDITGIIAATGVSPRRKEETAYPWPRRAVPAGHLELLDVGAAAREYFRIYGEPPADDGLWEALQQMYEYEPAMDPAFLATLASSPTAVWAPGAREQHLHTACTENFEDVRLPELVGLGVLRPITREEATSKGRFIQSLRGIPKGKPPCPSELVALAGGDTDSPLPPTGLAAAGKLAHKAALEMVREIATAVAAGVHPPHAAEAAFAARCGKVKTRAIVDGHHISKSMHGDSFRFHYNDYLLSRADSKSVGFVQDLSNYFHAIMLSPAQRKLWTLVYTDRHGVTHFYECLRMPMGSKTAPSVAQAASALMTAIAMGRGVPATVSPYVDDFRTVCRADVAPEVTAQVANVINLVYPGGEALDKRTPPSSTPRFLGQVLDLRNGTVSLPVDTFYVYALHLSFAHTALSHPDHRVRACITTSSLQKLCGRLCWMSEVVPLGRSYLGGLYSVIHSVGLPSRKQRQRLMSDLGWWRRGFLEGKLHPATIVTGGVAQLYALGGGTTTPATATQASDAGEPGGAAISNGRATHVTFTAAQRKWSSTLREMVAIHAGLSAFDVDYVGKRVTVLTDSMAAAGALNKGRSRDPAINALVRHVLQRAAGKYVMVAVFIPRERNVGCDRLAGCGTQAAAVAEASALGVTLVSSAAVPKSVY